MKIHLWPWTRTIVERTEEQWLARYERLGVHCPENDRHFKREAVIYKITNHWTGSERLEKTYLNKKCNSSE